MAFSSALGGVARLSSLAPALRVGFSRAIRGGEASPGGVALLLRCASKRRFLPCSPLARASREPKPPRVATLVHQALPHRLARQTIAYILHVLSGVERASRHIVQQAWVKPRGRLSRGGRKTKAARKAPPQKERKKRTANEVRCGRDDEAERSETADCGSRITPADASEARRRYPADKASRRGWRAVSAGAGRRRTAATTRKTGLARYPARPRRTRPG